MFGINCSPLHECRLFVFRFVVIIIIAVVVLTLANIFINFILLLVAPILNPSDVHGCPEQMVNFTCTILGGTTLRWRVDFTNPSLPEIQRSFLEKHNIGRTFVVPNTEGFDFRFVLISREPIVSTMTTNIVQNLYGASVSCENLHSLQFDTSRIHNLNGICVNVIFNNHLHKF